MSAAQNNPVRAPLFTIFTATYNRAHTLHRVFDSLRGQTCRDFEWLLVDDGSTDDTASLIADWARAADFPIRYLYQANAGKHVAHNAALREARGQFFLPLDSDDACPPHALERMAYHWETIQQSERTAFCGVGGHCANQHGEIVGDPYPQDPFDVDLRELKYVHHVRGEKWIAVLTDVARRYPFVEVPGTKFVPEGVVWMEMAKRYKVRWVNEVFRIYYFNDDATGPTLTTNRNLPENAPGRLHHCIWLLNNDLGYFFHAPMPFVKAAVMVPNLARVTATPFGEMMASLKNLRARALVVLGLPAALAMLLLKPEYRAVRPPAGAAASNAEIKP